MNYVKRSSQAVCTVHRRNCFIFFLIERFFFLFQRKTKENTVTEGLWRAVTRSIRCVTPIQCFHALNQQQKRNKKTTEILDIVSVSLNH